MGLFSRKSDAAETTTAAPTADLAHLTGEYTIDPTHSEVGFSVRHAMVTTVRGQFAEYEGKLSLDGAKPANSSAEVSIKVVSVDTNQAQRDEHLRTGDFFDVATYPEISFRSTSAEQVDDETYRMHGDLTIKGTTKPVSIDFTYNGSATDPYGNLRVGFEGSTTVNRGDWGLTYNAALEGGGVLISDKVKLTFDISAIKAA
ncbi:YceI family protein [Streptomyces sp. NPDC026673]|uniref:YceI family protein n=1 Tax=Streptomyces sp. NPDC026673 TaxID=3155724 RepID=UPI0033C7DAAD